MTLEAQIRAAHARGLKVNNLFEPAKGGWQANLRDADGVCRRWGFGETPEAAMRDALGAEPLRPAIPLREPAPATDDLL